jgi:hypothetical protein
MKAKNVVQVITETYDEQQFILSRFPESFWFVEEEDRTRFYIPVGRQEEVYKTIIEWHERNK